MCKLKLSLVIPTADKHYSFKEQVKAATYRYKMCSTFRAKKKASLGRRTLAHLAIHRCAIFHIAAEGDHEFLRADALGRPP